MQAGQEVEHLEAHAQHEHQRDEAGQEEQTATRAPPRRSVVELLVDVVVEGLAAGRDRLPADHTGVAVTVGPPGAGIDLGQLFGRVGISVRHRGTILVGGRSCQ